MKIIICLLMICFSAHSLAADAFSAQITFSKFKEKDIVKVNKAVELIKKIVLSPEFKESILNFTFNGERQFLDNLGLTNQQIYDKILDGSEVLNPGVDHQMDLDLRLYFSFSSTIGHTYPGISTISLNKRFFRDYTAAEVAGNLFHEWLHKLGFSHDFSYSPSRDYSVPYAIGYMVEDYAKALLDNQPE